LILLLFERLATVRTGAGINAVPHQNIVLHELVKLIPWGGFEAAVARHGADRGRDLTSRQHLLALLYGQFAGAVSLREIVDGLASHAARLYRLGGAAVKRSTLAEANRRRPSAPFADLLGMLMAQAHRGLRRKLADSVYLIDASGLPLTSQSADWARFSAKVCGAKLHVVYDPQADCPIYAAVSAGKVNDITPAKAMPVEPGATYVFDLGYYDYAWWAKLHEAGCRIVTRFKRNTPLAAAESRPLGPGGAILSDRVGQLPKRQARSRKNPFAAPVREVRVRLDTGKVLRILTNDLEAGAQQIADLYKRRWAIELFFRWVKQTLKVRHFLGASENAVRIQLAVAPIAFLLLRLAHAATDSRLGLLAFTRLVRANLMHRRPIGQLLAAEPDPPESQPQLGFAWAPT
jgi:hypothetical protein